MWYNKDDLPGLMSEADLVSGLHQIIVAHGGVYYTPSTPGSLGLRVRG